MLESMPENHLFKSSGSVTCQGQQMFYQLLLSNSQYLIKFYDSLGKVRLIRPILLPAENVEFHGVGEYLLCYESAGSPQASGCFYLVQLSNLNLQTQKLNMNLVCSSDQKVKIRRLHCSLEMRIIIFSDVQENVYILKIYENDYQITFLYKHDKEISELSIDQTGSVVITNKNGGIRVLEIDEIQFKVNNRKDWPNVIKYFRGDKFIAHYTKQRQWRKDQEDDLQLQSNFLLINDEGADPQQLEVDKFICEFKNDSEIMIKSGKRYLIVFNRTHNIIHSIFNGMQRFTNAHDNLMKDLQQDNFLINFKTDQSFNVLLQIRVFADITEKFTLHQYEISKKQNASHQNYLKRNSHNIYQFNGLILPLYERQVHKELNAFINSLEQYKNSNESRMVSQESMNQSLLLKGDISPYELGLTLLKISLQHFPSSLDKLVRKIKNNIQFNKSVCYIEQTHRYYEYCEYILEQNIQSLIGVSRSIEEESHVSGSLKSKDKDELQRIYNLLENMINFLFGLNSALKIEVSEDQKLTKNKQSNKKQQQRLAYYEKVYNISRSFFLVVMMLEDEQILTKFQDRFRKIQENKKKYNQIWKLNNQLVKLDYRPLYLHEHFEMIALLTKQQRLTLTHLIKFIMTNRSNFLQNAYFYQSITKNNATPFLQTDICDLIQNICFHMPLIKGNIQLDEESFKQKIDLLHKMSSTALKIANYPFLKYMIQLNVLYQQFSLVGMLIFSDSLKIPGDYDITERIKNEHILLIKSLIISNRIDLAQMYMLDHYDTYIFEEFLRLAQTNGNAAEVLNLYQKNFILNIDQNKLREILQIDSNKWSILFGSETISNLSAKTS